MTPGLLKADRTAGKFTGLPNGVQSYGQLLAAFKAAAPRLGISPRHVHALDWLFCFTEPQDWAPDSRPIVWPSAVMQQRAFGLEPTQVKEINRRLIDLGLVTMKDSPNGKRYGRRHEKTKKIIEAYGFDLSPMAARYAEFERLAEADRAERRALAKLKRRKTIARKAIAQILETAREYGFDGEEWRILARETSDLVRALSDVERLDEMEAGVTSLERRQMAARERIELLLGTVETDPKETENRPHKYNYNPTDNLNKDTVIAANRCSGAGEASPSPALTSVPRETPQSVSAARPSRIDKGMVHGISAGELPRLAPKLKSYLRRPDPSWPDIVDAADYLRGDLGVSKSLWGEACLAMGRDLAAVAIAIVSTKEPEHFKSSPGGYFHGMVAKHIAGELHLERTVWALRRALHPEHADRSGGSNPQAADRDW
jgi:replication initiation protein RepC